MGQVISVAEAARRSGMTRPAIDRHVRAGRIARLERGLDLASFSVWLATWEKQRDRRASATASTVAPDSIDEPQAARSRAAEDLIEQHGVFETRAEAERHRDSFVARLRQIEFDLRSAAVVEVEEVARQVGTEYASLRTRLLSIPAEQAPALHRCKSVPELQTALEVVVTRALETLSLDRFPSR